MFRSEGNPSFRVRVQAQARTRQSRRPAPPNGEWRPGTLGGISRRLLSHRPNLTSIDHPWDPAALACRGSIGRYRLRRIDGFPSTTSDSAMAMLKILLMHQCTADDPRYQTPLREAIFEKHHRLADYQEAAHRRTFGGGIFHGVCDALSTLSNQTGVVNSRTVGKDYLPPT